MTRRATRAEPGIPVPDVPVEDDYRRLDGAFARAWSGCPELRHSARFVFADRTARFRVVGAGLAHRVFRAFSHLRDGEERSGSASPDGPREPSLTVDLWAEDETGIGVEGLTPGADLNAPGETLVSADGRVVVTSRTQTRTAFDRRDERIVGWVARSDDLTQYEIGRPLHSELLLWHKDRGFQAVHCGLVASDGRGVLMGGPGGSGKSTVALTCLEAGFHYLADDYVALERLESGAYVGHSLYCSIHLEPTHIVRFPSLVPHSIPGRLPREDKHLVLLSDILPEGLGRRAEIRALLLPRVTGGSRPTLRRATKVEALLRLAPSSLLMLPYAGIGATEFEKLTRFVEETPTHWLELGEGMEEIPVRVSEVLEAHA